MDKIIRGYFLLPLFYLTMTSGLPPGTKRMEVASNSSSSSIIIETLQEIISTTVGSSTLADTTAAPSLSSIGLGESKETSTSTSTSTMTTSFSYTNSILGSNSTSNDSDTKHDETHHSTIDTPIIAPLVQNITKVPLRGKCNTTSQCFGEYTECRLNVCKCMPGYLPRIDNGDLCGEASLHFVELPKADPTMIGVVIGLILMSVTLCVVLRLFAKARFRENRTIFNTPNPRLMNVSLLKGGSKTLLRGNSAPRSRRGSTASARSGLEVGTPTSPMNEHALHSHYNHESGNGNAIPLAGASSRPKPSRQISSDAGGDSTPNINRNASAVNKQKFRHQDSVASNV